MSNSRPPGVVGFVGLGTMGSELIQQAQHAGARVIGFDIDADRRDLLRQRGVKTRESIVELVKECSWIVTSLPNPDSVVQVAKDVATEAERLGVSPSIIETSTVSVEDKESARSAARSVGLQLFDCPLSGTGKQAQDGDLVAYVSGARDGIDEVIRVMSLFTRAQYNLGEFGNGTRMKLIANLLVAIHNVSAAEALVLADKTGLDLETVLRAISDGAGSSRMFEIRGPAMVAGDYAPTMRVDTFLKDLDIIEKLASIEKAHTPLFTVAHEVYRELGKRGMAGKDTAIVHELLKEPEPTQTWVQRISNDPAYGSLCES